MSQRAPLFAKQWPAARMFEKKLSARVILIKNQRNALIARPPWIAEQRVARRFKIRGILVAKKFQRLPQRRTPLLIPSRFTSGVTTTIANPTPHPVRTTPRSAFPARPLLHFNFT